MKIILNGEPIAKKRPRIRMMGKHPMMYDPLSKDKEMVKKHFAFLLEVFANSSNKRQLLEVSDLARADYYEVSFKFYCAPPASDSTIKKNAKLWDFIPHSKKNDLDNIEKFYLDCGNGILWGDDAKITKLTSSKRYSQNPRTEITILGKRIQYDMESPILQFSPDELKEFAKDVRCLSFLDSDYMECFEGDARKVWLHSAATSLKRFADKHSARLKKIATKEAKV